MTEQPTLDGITQWDRSMAKLKAAFEAARGKKSPQSAPGEATEAHVHDWRKYKQSIRPDNPDYDYRHSTRHFIVLACECKEKRYVDLILR